MNPQAHRLIFNPHRGQLMAVAETASAQGKSASGESPITGTAAVVACIALAFSLLQALPPPSQAASSLSDLASIQPLALITPALSAIYSGVSTLLQTTSSFSQKTESGLLSGGGFGVTVGHRDLSQDAGNTTTTNAASTVGSVGGNVTLSGKNYVQTGSDVSTPGQGGPSGSGDITINAQNVAITEAREASNSQTQTKFSQSGITVAISNPVVGAVQSADQLRQAASKTSDTRMQALAAASATLGAKSAVTDKDGKFDADKASSVSVSVSLGQSKSQSNSTTTADTAGLSTLTAGGNITINAKTVNGGELANPADSNITLQGVQIKAGDAVTLDADNRVNILAAKNTQTQSSTNSSSSASVGVAIQYGAKGIGYGFTAAASAARGSSDGTDTTFTNSHISAGNQVNITSGGDTTIKGGVVTANTVKANVGGDLKVESLQDTSVFTGKQSSAGGSVMIGAGGGGSVNIANSKASGDFASVTEQSGIKAGDGGFQVSTQGDTTLTGGAITSTQAAVDAGANTFTTSKLTTSDIQNRDNYSASGFSVGLSTSTDSKGKSTPSASLGVGSASGSQSSSTQAAISGIAGNTAARTGDTSTGLVKTWDGQKMLADVNAKTQITAAFGNQASKAIGDYANKKQAELQAQGNPEEAAKWAEGGTYRAGLHAVVGGLTGGVQGALGAGTSQLAIDSIGKTIASSDLPTEVKQALIAGAGTVVGAAVGGSAGAAAAGNATVNNYLNHVELSERATKQTACDKGDKTACGRVTELDARSASRNSTIQNGLPTTTVTQNLSIMDNLSTVMSGLGEHKANLETQLAATTDSAQRASLQNQINQDDNNMRQVAGLGKDTLATLYQQTGDQKYQTAYQTLNASTSGNEIAGAIQGVAGMAGAGSKKPGVANAEGTGAKLPPATDGTATSPYSSSGTTYGKTTLTDVNGNPIMTQPSLPSAGGNAGVAAVDGASSGRGLSVTYTDPATGVATINLTTSVSGAQISRLSTGSSAAPHEVQVAAQLENATGSTIKMVEKPPANPDGSRPKSPDFVFESGPNAGKTGDFMFTADPSKVPLMNGNFDRNWPKTEFNLNAHLTKADIVVLDFTNLTPVNQLQVNNWINTLTPAQRGQILIRR